jgi:hypothetical protein
MKQSFADCLVSECGRMCLKGAPVLGIGPLLMCVKFVEI